jgi:transcriptional regulator with XRE-family HTH domain
MPRTISSSPTPVRRALRQLGSDIRTARIRRRLPMAVVAERALTTRPTLTKVERGDPAVSIGTYATVLFVLGLIDRLATVAGSASDEVGLALDESRHPRRVRTPIVRLP